MGIFLLRRAGRYRAAGGGPVLNGPDDTFDYGSAIDTAGARYTGAYPWTLQNNSGGSTAVAAGALAITAPAVGSWSPMLATQAMDAGDGRWRTQMTTAGGGANFKGSGLVLRESGTGKQLCWIFGTDAGAIRAQVRRMPGGYSSWTGNYYGLVVADFAGYVEIVREGGTLRFIHSEDGINWFHGTEVAQTADFTTAPDQVGVCTGSQSGFGVQDVGTFQAFRKDDQSLPYGAPLLNWNAEAGTLGFVNVSGPNFGTRGGTGRSGSNSFMINGTGAFSKYLPWRPIGFNSLIDAGTLTVTIAAWGYTWTGSTSSFYLEIECRDGSGTVLGTSSPTGTWGPSGTMTQKSTNMTVPSGTREIRINWKGTCNAAQDCWPDEFTMTLS
jgi:hypothetical protein